VFVYFIVCYGVFVSQFYVVGVLPFVVSLCVLFVADADVTPLVVAIVVVVVFYDEGPGVVTVWAGSH
jgi:hypothetical protein